jgi:phytoene dehydrogenase-like protein
MWGFRFDTGLHILLFGVVRELQAELGVELASGPLVWSPTEVMLLLTDRLPRKAILDAAQRTALPNVLRQWLTYALDKRGVDPRWITPVADAVDAHLPEFRQAFDDRTSWSPAKQIAAALTDRGIDLTDRQAVDDAIRALNAERLARRLLP